LSSLDKYKKKQISYSPDIFKRLHSIAVIVSKIGVENMEESIDYRPSNRVKITQVYNKECCSTFERLPGELILKVLQYFNTKEIAQSFLNLTPLVNSCISDPQHKLHLYLDREMPFFPGNYSPAQVISLYIELLSIPLDTFSKLKSLHIVHDNEREGECLNMIKQVATSFSIKLENDMLCFLDFQTVDSTGQFYTITNRF